MSKHMVGFSGNQLPSPTPQIYRDPKGLMTNNRTHSYHSGNSKDFSSSASGTGDEDQLYC